MSELSLWAFGITVGSFYVSALAAVWAVADWARRRRGREIEFVLRADDSQFQEAAAESSRALNRLFGNRKEQS